MESWLSGRKRFTANEVSCKRLQGFESLTLRTLELARDTSFCPTYVMSDYYIFSDESGAWQDAEDVYVRSWICVDEANNQKITEFINSIREGTGADEVKWKTVASIDLKEQIAGIDFKVFVTATEIKSIKDEKYLLTRSFPENMEAFDFGELRAETISKIKDKVYLDIKYVLFLHIYESLHLRSAQEIFSTKFPDKTFEYVIDPPQMLNKDWSQICEDLTGYKPTFPDSERVQGIQFADIVAGAWRSFLIQDKRLDKAENFVCTYLMPNKMLYVQGCPNPNLIIYDESSDEIKERSTVTKCKS